MYNRSPWQLYGSFFAFAPTLVWMILAAIGANAFYGGPVVHLRKSANASTVEIAHKELGRTLEILEERKMTEGYTSAFWKSEDEDVGSWYGNLKALHESLSDGEMEVVYSESDGQISLGEPVAYRPKAKMLSLESQSMVMSRVRDIILDHEGNISAPDGITRFPDNQGMAKLFLGQILTFVVGIYLLFRYLW